MSSSLPDPFLIAWPKWRTRLAGRLSSLAKAARWQTKGDGVIHRSLTFTGALLLIAVIGAIHQRVGPALSFAPLCLAIVALATWIGSRTLGIAVAGLAVVADVMGVGPLSQLSGWAWDPALETGVFVASVVIVSRVRRQTRALSVALRSQIHQTRRALDEQKRAEDEAEQALRAQREAMADQLHDGLAQTLTAVALRCKHLEEDLDACGSPHAQVAGQAASLLGDAVAQARKIARGLHAMEIDAHELIGALVGLAAATEETHHIGCRIQANRDSLLLNPEKGLHVYLVAQQAIDNAIRHGASKNITIEVSVDGDELSLIVHDDGCGFDAARGPGAGLGMRLMRFRASLLAGRLTVISGKNQGTRVELIAPIPSPMSGI